jgi:hypothetical protein
MVVIAKPQYANRSVHAPGTKLKELIEGVLLGLFNALGE